MSTRSKQFYTLLQSQPFLLPPTNHQTSPERRTWLRTLSIHGTPKITKKVKSQATGILGKHSWIQQRLVQRLDLLTKCCWVSITQPSIVPVTRGSQGQPGASRGPITQTLPCLEANVQAIKRPRLYTSDPDG